MDNIKRLFILVLSFPRNDKSKYNFSFHEYSHLIKFVLLLGIKRLKSFITYMDLKLYYNQLLLNHYILIDIIIMKNILLLS